VKRGKPLTRSTPLKRTGFKAKTLHHNPRKESKLQLAAHSLRCPQRPRAVVMARELASEAPVLKPKADPVRSEAYLALVRKFPCRSCGRHTTPERPIQAAHMNLGKGAGMKVDDRLTFPLCNVCHAILDQPGPSDALTKAERRRCEARWTLDTLELVIMADRWPESVRELEREHWEMLSRWAQ
jgi:hypothetical protein